MGIANPPIQTPPLTAAGRFQAVWVSWLGTIKTVTDALATLAGGALQAANNLADLASSPAALNTLIGAWQAWVPVITCDAGMVVSAVTLTVNEFVQLGPVILFRLNVSFTLSGTAATRVWVTLPTLPIDTSGAFAITAGSSSTNQAIAGRTDPANYALFRPVPSGNWTLGAQSFIASGVYRRV